MSEKFTPGPWVRMNVTDVFTDGKSGQQIADCMPNIAVSINELAANAALIAAAPELYEALEWAYRVHGEHGGPLGLGVAMKAALEKARGES